MNEKKTQPAPGPMVKLSIDPEVWHRILFIMRECSPYEVQMLGELEEIGSPERPDNFQLGLRNVYLVKQKVSQVSADFSMEALANFVGNHPHPEKLWCWIHSHVNMGVFWSSTDEATVQRLSQGSGKLLSLVLCLDGRILGRMDLDYTVLLRGSGIPFAEFLPAKVRTDAVEVVVQPPFSEEELEAMRADIKDKVELVKVSRRSSSTSPVPLSVKIEAPAQSLSETAEPLNQGMLPLSMERVGNRTCKDCGRTYGRWFDNVLKVICEREFKTVEPEQVACKSWIPRSGKFEVKEDLEEVPFDDHSEDIPTSANAEEVCADCDRWLTAQDSDGSEGFCGVSGERTEADHICTLVEIEEKEN